MLRHLAGRRESQSRQQPDLARACWFRGSGSAGRAGLSFRLPQPFAFNGTHQRVVENATCDDAPILEHHVDVFVRSKIGRSIQEFNHDRSTSEFGM
jgi:hypothetical protein